MTTLTALRETVAALLTPITEDLLWEEAFGELTLTVPVSHWVAVARMLKEAPQTAFEQLIDLCGVDYLLYGCSEWATQEATHGGFERAVERDLHRIAERSTWTGQRFAVVIHLLSLKHRHRLRVKSFLEADPPQVNSLVEVWASANWFEREAFDLFGFFFHGHPDLRRLLTDYGFVGHPFRKDFPVSGYVEVHYDASVGQVIQKPVSIAPRVLVPRVVRHEPQLGGTGSSHD